MARRFVVELLDAFAQIGLGDLDPASLQERARVAFLGQHRLRLHEVLGAVRGEDVVDDLVVLVGIPRPVDLHAVTLCARLEELEIVRKVRQRMLLDLRRQVAQFLPLRDLACRRVAPLRWGVRFGQLSPERPFVPAICSAPGSTANSSGSCRDAL
jgi:hypothetical protein